MGEAQLRARENALKARYRALLRQKAFLVNSLQNTARQLEEIGINPGVVQNAYPLQG
jgi:hypothetical protein